MLSSKKIVIAREGIEVIIQLEFFSLNTYLPFMLPSGTCVK